MKRISEKNYRICKQCKGLITSAPYYITQTSYKRNSYFCSYHCLEHEEANNLQKKINKISNKYYTLHDIYIKFRKTINDSILKRYKPIKQ